MYIKNRLALIEGAETMLAQEHRMEQISNNLANVDTTGYKKEDVTFWEMMFTAQDNRPRVGKAMKVITNQDQGSLSTTGNTLDFGISGPGYFKIQTPDGIRYTRNGNFTLNNGGQLSTMDGNLVLGAGGPIALESDDVQVGRDGLISANGEAVNQLALAMFDDPTNLVKEGKNLFRTKNDQVQESPPVAVDIKQGHLESSNVNVIQEMTEMIDLHRAYQSQQKLIQSVDELDAIAISRVGKLT